MARAEDVVNRIRRVLARYDGAAMPEAAAELAEEYATAVEEVNARVQRCVALLRQGHRGDAVYQAELAPPVVEEAAALDFPERDRWEELCRQHGLGGVPEIDAEAVVELDEAYEQEQAVEPLLRAHRRLALGHGPLSARIRVLQKLAQAEPDNAVWPRALARYEKARHEQIEREAQHAYERGDVQVLRRLHEEVAGSAWTEPPPQTLRRAVERCHLKLRDKEARQRLDRLRGVIAEAHAAEDLYRTAGLLDDWKRTCERLTGNTPPTPDEVAAARRWVHKSYAEAEEAEAFRRACALLEAALDHNEPMERLDRLWGSVTRYERPVPNVLASRFRARLAEHRLEARRRFQLILSACLAALLLVGAGVGFLVYRSQDARQAEQWKRQISGYVEDGQWAEAQRLLDRLEEDHRGLWGRPTFQELLLEVERGLTADELRRERFETAITRAERAPRDAPDREAMAEARELAATDEEQLRVERLAAEIERYQAEAQQARDEAFSAELDRFRRTFADLRASGGDAETVRDALRGLASELADALEAEISPPLLRAGRSLLETVNREVATYDERIADARERDQLLADIREAWAEPARLAEALRAFREAFPEDAYAEEIGDAVALAERAAAVERVGAFFTSSESLRVASHEQATAQHDRVTRLLDEAGGRTPYAAALGRYLNYLEQAAATLDPQRGPDRPGGPLDRLLSHRLIDDMQMMTHEDGRRFYFPESFPPEEIGGEATLYRVRYIREPDQRFTDDALPRLRELHPRDAFREGGPVASPQTAFARAARQRVESGEPAWEHRHASLAEQVAADEQIDPLLKVMLLEPLLRLGMDWGWRMPELDDWLTRAEELIERDVNWIAPENADAEPHREEARELIAALPDFDAHREAVRQWAASMRQELQPPPAVGLIWPAASQDAEDRGGEERRIVGGGLAGETGALVVLAADDADGPTRFRTIGRVERGRVTWRADAGDVPMGTLVYLEKP